MQKQTSNCNLIQHMHQSSQFHPNLNSLDAVFRYCGSNHFARNLLTQDTNLDKLVEEAVKLMEEYSNVLTRSNMK